MAFDYSNVIQGETFSLVKISTKRAVHLRMIVGLEINNSGQCVVRLADDTTLISDLTFQEIYGKYNRKVLMTYQSQAGIKPESDDTNL